MASDDKKKRGKQAGEVARFARAAASGLKKGVTDLVRTPYHLLPGRGKRAEEGAMARVKEGFPASLAGGIRGGASIRTATKKKKKPTTADRYRDR